MTRKIDRPIRSTIGRQRTKRKTKEEEEEGEEGSDQNTHLVVRTSSRPKHPARTRSTTTKIQWRPPIEQCYLHPKFVPRGRFVARGRHPRRLFQQLRESNEPTVIA